jgi:hypothetical protein
MAFTTELPAEYRTLSRRDYEKRKENLLAESIFKKIPCKNNDGAFVDYFVYANTNKTAQNLRYTIEDNIIVIYDKDPKRYILENSSKIENLIYKEYNNSLFINKDSYLKIAESLKSNISQLKFSDIILEFLPNESIQYTLSFTGKKLLMIDQFLEPESKGLENNQIIFSFFISRKLIASNVVEASDFVKKFQEYISL